MKHILMFSLVKKAGVLVFLLFCFSRVALSQCGNALDYDGVDDYVSVPGASSLVSGAPGMTLTCWVYPSNPNPAWPNFDGFAGFRNEQNADFYLLQIGPDAVEARFRNSAGQNFDIVYNGLVLNTWQHLAFTYDGNQIVLYFNGQAVMNTPANGNISNTGVALLIGDVLYSTTNFYLLGKTDEVSLWSKALTQFEVQDIYTAGINPSQPDLKLYYKFDQGIPGGNNSGLTTLIDSEGNLNGTLMNFALNGATSNWVQGITSVTYANATICDGQSYIFGTQVLTSPGTYTEIFQGTSGCDSTVVLTLSVIMVNTAVTVTGVTITASATGANYMWVDCNNGYSLIPGAYGQSYTATANGNYAVIVIENGCADTSECIPVTTVGLDLLSAEAGIQVYPNPATNTVYFDFGTPGNRSVRLTDLYGRELIGPVNCDLAKMELDITSLRSGIYFAEIGRHGTLIRVKLLK